MQFSDARRDGFTLVEIMIVVAIIALLAAMAYPAFKRVVENSANKRADNDARQIASAAQQYILDNPGTGVVTVGVNSSSGALTGVLSSYVRQVSRGTVIGDFDPSADPAFTMSYVSFSAAVTAAFDGEGKRLP